MDIQLEVTGDREDLEKSLEAAGATEISVVSRRNLTGTEPIIIALFQLAMASIPVIVEIVRARKPLKIRIGQVEIENPSPEDVKSVLDRLAPRSES